MRFDGRVEPLALGGRELVERRWRHVGAVVAGRHKHMLAQFGAQSFNAAVEPRLRAGVEREKSAPAAL